MSLSNRKTEFLPVDLLGEILSHLDGETLLECLRVNRTWYVCIHDKFYKEKILPFLDEKAQDYLSMTDGHHEIYFNNSYTTREIVTYYLDGPLNARMLTAEDRRKILANLASENFANIDSIQDKIKDFEKLTSGLHAKLNDIPLKNFFGSFPRITRHLDFYNKIAKNIKQLIGQSTFNISVGCVLAATSLLQTNNFYQIYQRYTEPENASGLHDTLLVFNSLFNSYVLAMSILVTLRRNYKQNFKRVSSDVAQEIATAKLTLFESDNRHLVNRHERFIHNMRTKLDKSWDTIPLPEGVVLFPEEKKEPPTLRNRKPTK